MPQIAAALLPLMLLAAPSIAVLADKADEPTNPAIDRAAILRWVEQLGDDRFEVRQRASRLLWEAGEAAEPALVQATKSEDPEVVSRARRILGFFQFGIYPGTSREVIEAITRFRYGSLAVKQAVLRELMDRGEMATLMRLVKTLPNETLRRDCTLGLVKDLDKIGGKFFLGPDRDKAEQLLEMGAITQKGMRNYSAYLLLRGQLDEKIQEVRTRVDGTANQVDAQLLAYLLRAEGHMAGAVEAARKAGNAETLSGMLFESADWTELARAHATSADDPMAPFSSGIVFLGYAAAYHRLSNNPAELDKAIAAIERLADAKPNKVNYCGEALLINGQYQRAIDIFGKQGKSLQFDVLVRQLRLAEALKLAGIDDPRDSLSPWFAPLEAAAESVPPSRRDRFTLGLKVAALLHRLGETHQAEGLLSELADEARTDSQLSLRAVCQAAVELGMTDRAFELAALLLAQQRANTVTATLFPDQPGLADFWWQYFIKANPDEPGRTTLDRVHCILEGKGYANHQWLDVIGAADQAVSELQPKEQALRLTVLADTCLTQDKQPMARDFLRRSNDLGPTVPTLMKLGDLAAEDTRWTEAIIWYAKASQAAPTKPTPLFLQGWAMVRADREPEGRRLMEAARLVPLGNAETRFDMAEQLRQRGLDEEAAHQFDLVLRTGEVHSGPVCIAADQLGDAIVDDDPLRAADCWQWILLRCLQTSSAKIGVTGFLERTHRIHKARARGLLATGKVDEALAEIERARAALPGDIGLACELVPLLRNAGRHREADELYEDVAAVNRRVCELFPNSQTHHDRLKELAAKCGRER